MRTILQHSLRHGAFPAIVAALLALLPSPTSAQVDARMFRQADVSADRIAFVYAGDIWVAPKEGGTAQRLSSPAGEEMFPRFSPDGSKIAFTGNYDGNLDVYVVPSAGGTPTRVTYHPAPDIVADWTAADRVLFASPRKSGVASRFSQLYSVSSLGGLAERLPIEYAETGAPTSDGNTVAFMMKSRDFRTWKRYRGGMAPDIHAFDLNTHASTNLTEHPANDGAPMWHGETLYFLSDRGANQRFNIWAREPSGTMRQVTDFSDFDITFPAIGPTDIVFQAGGRLYLLDLATEATREVAIDVVTDFASLKPRTENVAGLLAGDGSSQGGWAESPAGVSPTGQRAVFEARGDIFTVPAEHGPVRNLTRSSGVADRNPAWSPDGRWIAWWSDATGEYELTVQAADGSGEPRTVTSLGAGYRYTPVWSPDSRMVAFVDQDAIIRVADVESGRVREVARSPGQRTHAGLVGFRLSWSRDSRWLAFSLPDRGTAVDRIRLFDSTTGQTHAVTSGYYNDFSPVFDPDGRYLYILTDRRFAPSYSSVDGTWIYANSTQIAAIPLRADVPSPIAARSDDETVADDSQRDADASSLDDAKAGDGEAPRGGEAAAAAIAIDLEDFERRLVVLPIEPGRFSDLTAVSGKVLYRRLIRTGAAAGDTPLAFWDLSARKEQTVLKDADDALVTADGKKALVRTGPRFGIIPLAPNQTVETPLRASELMAPVDPRAEWRQIVLEAWRLERDYFYDADMHGVDWAGIRDQYLPLVEDAVTRWDVNFIIGEMIAELDASHTYRGGGDQESAPGRPVGLLGVDWALDNGAYRIAHIVRGGAWDNEVRSPLDAPGIAVDEGDYVLAVNGVPFDTAIDPSAAFEGLSGKDVTLTVAEHPDGRNRREVLVTTLSTGGEVRLRYLEWVERNRRMVEERSGGRVGYIHVPDTGIDGQTELVRQFAAWKDRDALIIDERFNSGGQLPVRFIELLDRPVLAWGALRYGDTLPLQGLAHRGPKAMLVNGWAGSGGDAFPDMFRKAGLGPLIGTRTWGGLIGYSTNPLLVDGGSVVAPTFRLYNTDGTWFAEGHGVDPDIEVAEDVTALAAGRDPQIERAVDELLRALEANPIVAPERPAPEDRSRPKIKATTNDGRRSSGGGGGSVQR